MATKPKIAPTSLDALRKTREIVAPGPSGHAYKIRPLNLERHALSGGLPAKLRALAMQGSDAVNAVLGGDDDTISEDGEAVKSYLDGLVAQVVVEPSLWADEDSKVIDDEAIELVPPVDYKWLLAVAMGETDEDGEGKRLWGREPLSRWATFRDFHGCSEDCDGCRELLDLLSAA